MYEMLPTERIALCTVHLMRGRAMTVREVAQELELTHSGAAKLLSRISRVLPMVDDGGVWRICGSDGTFGEVNDGEMGQA